MSCSHGNHEDNCDNCDEEIRQWTMGYERQLKELCALKEERNALKKENAAFKAVHTTWVDSATDFRDAVLHGLDGLHSDQTNTVLDEFDQFLPIAQPAHESITSDAIECVAKPVQPNNLEAAVFDAWEHYARMGSVCRFEGRSMIYASTLEEIYEAAIAQTVQEPLSDVSILNICSCSELMQLRKAANVDQLLICFARTILAAQQERKA